jgi:hypothetical protein
MSQLPTQICNSRWIFSLKTFLHLFTFDLYSYLIPYPLTSHLSSLFYSAPQHLQYMYIVHPPYFSNILSSYIPPPIRPSVHLTSLLFPKPLPSIRCTLSICPPLSIIHSPSIRLPLSIIRSPSIRHPFSLFRSPSICNPLWIPIYNYSYRKFIYVSILKLRR